MNELTEQLFDWLSRHEWTPLRRIRLAFWGFVVCVAIGGLGFLVFEPERGFWNSAWLAMITATTVGYGDHYPTTIGGRIVTIFILVTGFAFVSLATASFVEFLVGGQVARVLGRRKLERQLEELKDHYIVCGYGRMGQLICQEICTDVPVVVIERNDDVIRRLREEGRIYIRGDATEETALEKAGIERAKGLVSVVASDAENVFIVLTAREMSRGLYILARAIDEKTDRKLMRAGATKVVSPYLIGGQRMAQAIIRPAVVDFVEFAFHSNELDVHVEELTISASSELARLKLQESKISSHNVIVLAIKRSAGRMEFNPSSQTVIEPGDTLICLGPTSGLKALSDRV